jgi:hypothetical protein
LSCIAKTTASGTIDPRDSHGYYEVFKHKRCYGNDRGRAYVYDDARSEKPGTKTVTTVCMGEFKENYTLRKEE